MADINSNAKIPPQNSGGEATAGGAQARDAEAAWDIIELLFFAYRDFVGDPDAVLLKYAFGRAHHRVLHFVNRRPGLRVADLLDILRITKQSLARVLKQLVDRGFIAQAAGARDRRERRLHLTSQGGALAEQLAQLQVSQVRRALFEAGADGDEVVRHFLLAMIGPEHRASIVAAIVPHGPAELPAEGPVALDSDKRPEPDRALVQSLRHGPAKAEATAPPRSIKAR